MYKKIVAASIVALLLNACYVAPTGRGSGVMAAPPLPVVVELDEPYYYYRGYYYYYDNSRWRYADSRSGPWVELPRSHYPREVRYRGRGDDDRGRRWDRDDDRRYDRDDDNDRERRHRDRDRDRRRDDDEERWDRRNDRGG